MAKHTCGNSMCVICVHLKTGGDWWAVPANGEFYDWMCAKCLEKIRLGSSPDLHEVITVCPTCVRKDQGNARLHYPTEHGDGAWHYEAKQRS